MADKGVDPTTHVKVVGQIKATPKAHKAVSIGAAFVILITASHELLQWVQLGAQLARPTNCP